MTGEEFAGAMRNGNRAYGTMVVSDSPYWPKILGNVSGLDFVFIDTEHISIDRKQLSWMCRAYLAANLAPMVRIPHPDPTLARMALDGGATCIVAPYIETPEAVRGLVGAVKKAPIQGDKLSRILAGEPLDGPIADYVENYNSANCLIANIESVPAMEKLDAILAEPGLDGILIGPHDLSCSLGIAEEYGNPRFIAAVDTIIGSARRRGLSAGIHFTFLDHGLDAEIAWIEKGANLIVHSADVIAVRRAFQREFNDLRSRFESGPAADTEARLNI